MQYIGCFEIETGNIMICDPMTTTIATNHYELSDINTKHLDLNVEQGIWYAYHINSKQENVPTGFLIYHKKCNKELLSELTVNLFSNWIDYGTICSAFGHIIGCIDKKYYDNTDFLYSKFKDDVLYEISGIENWLEEEKLLPYENLIQLRNYLFTRKSFGDTYIKGIDLIEYIGKNKFKTKSNIWSMDCFDKVTNSNFPAATIKGGAISFSRANFVQCFGNTLAPTAIYIKLTDDIPDFYDSFKPPNVIYYKF